MLALQSRAGSLLAVEHSCPKEYPIHLRQRAVASLPGIDSNTTKLTLREYGYPNADIVEVSRAALPPESREGARSSAGATR